MQVIDTLIVRHICKVSDKLQEVPRYLWWYGAILLSKQHDVEYECLNDYNVQFFQMYYHLKFMPKSFQHIVNIVPESGHLFGLTLRIRFGGRPGGDRNQEGADCFTWDECSHSTS